MSNKKIIRQLDGRGRTNLPEPFQGHDLVEMEIVSEVEIIIRKVRVIHITPKEKEDESGTSEQD